MQGKEVEELTELPKALARDASTALDELGDRLTVTRALTEKKELA